MKLISKITLSAVAFLLLANLGFAQQLDPKKELPLDPKVKYGVLDNGLTYYIVHNEEPKDRASFYIIQNVGAILENDDQNGLAHFLEHMAFNGTENFKGKGVLEYLESYGVQFGRNINAYTNTNETVYNLSNVPTNNQNLLDSTLLVLHDWSNYLSLNEEEIDNERGVIHEEWRTRRSGGMRVYLESMKYYYQGSKYAERDVIGSLDVIDNFEYQTIRDFYHDWYRTDLQAIAIVGDFDADKMETKVKEMFSHIPAVENPKERYFPEIPGNKEPIVGIIKDPEARNIAFNLHFKHPVKEEPQKNLTYYRESLIHGLYSTMLGTRFQELVQKGNPPFVYGYAAYYERERLLNNYDLGTSLKADNISGGIEALLIENERVLRHGFVDAELDRAKTNMLSSYEKAYKERNKQNNDKIAGEIKTNYLTGEPMPGIELEYQLAQQLLPTISVEEVSALAKKWNTEENRVFILSGPEKEEITYPTETDLLAIYDKVKQSKIEPYKDNTITAPLVAETPQGSKVVSEKELPTLGATEWTLANGAKVIIKTTDFKDDEILLSAFSKGGSSMYKASELPSVDFTTQFAGAFGIGQFDAMNLQKLLTGKVVGLSPNISDLYEGFNGSSSIKDFETLLQLQYLMFEQPRFDADAFGALKQRYAAYVANMNADINKIFQDSISVITTNYNERTHLFNTEFIEKLDFETVKKVYQDRFVDASDFTFVLVGNINKAEAKPLIETYIGGIKATDRSETWVDNKVNYPNGNVAKTFNTVMETPKTSIYANIHGEMKYTLENRIQLNLAKQLIDKRYLEIIREKEGGSYGVRVGASVEHFPNQEFSLMLKFDTDPEKAEKLKAIAYEEIEKLYTVGINETEFKEAKQNMLKVKQENLRKNGYWIGSISHQYKHNENAVSIEEYEKIVNSITKNKIEKFVQSHFSKAEKVEVVMHPAK